MMVLGFLSVGVAFLLLANFVFYAMLGEVNGRRPADRQISMWVIHIGKFMEVWGEHRRLYPDSKKQLQFTSFVLATLVFCLVAAYFFLGARW